MGPRSEAAWAEVVAVAALPVAALKVEALKVAALECDSAHRSSSFGVT